jgi:hypothetical protein
LVNFHPARFAGVEPLLYSSIHSSPSDLLVGWYMISLITTSTAIITRRSSDSTVPPRHRRTRAL